MFLNISRIDTYLNLMNVPSNKNDEKKYALVDRSLYLPHYGIPLEFNVHNRNWTSLEIDSWIGSNKSINSTNNNNYMLGITIKLFWIKLIIMLSLVLKYKNSCTYAVLSSVWYAANVIFGKYAIKNNPKLTSYDINFMRGIISIFIMSYQMYSAKSDVFKLWKKAIIFL